MPDAGLAVKLAIAQDLCCMRLRRCWGVWSGVAVSVSSRSSRCLQKRWRRERTFRQWRVGTVTRVPPVCGHQLLCVSGDVTTAAALWMAEHDENAARDVDDLQVVLVCFFQDWQIAVFWREA